ncbi:MAG: type II secretion system protein [Planctomycetes bacterium]|nr:type II secretion system protein [Planctomycetota bacterium]
MRRRHARSGFTLAEVAVTIVIVGTMLIYLLQGLNGTKLLAAQTRNNKLSRELALQKLGQVGSGIFQEDIDKGLTGTFADEGYPDFSYEVVVGDESFREQENQPQNAHFDSWNPPNKQDEKDPTDPNAEPVEQPFEKVKIRVTSPKIQEFSNQLTLEQWFPWVQVYGEKQDDPSASGQSGTANGTTTPANNGASRP